MADTSIDNIEFTARVFSIVRSAGPDEADEWVNLSVKEGRIDQDNYRVHQARQQIKDSREQLARFNELIVQDSTGLLSVKYAEPVAISPIGGIPSKFWTSTPDGLYQTTQLANPVSNVFGIDHIDKDTAEKFEAAGFSSEAPTVVEDRVYVASSMQLSAIGWSDATAFSMEGYFHPTRSARMPRLTASSVVRDASNEVPIAYLLPFPYAARNYYHSMTEMAYGLRHINTVAEDVPIIYDEDPFGMLPTLMDYLNVDQSRLIRRAEAVDWIIKKAILPDAGPYYWSSAFVKFFRAAALAMSNKGKDGAKVYISRKQSVRSLPYEAELENYFVSLGFDVVYAQELSFIEQMNVFSHANVIVGAHGAGMANTVFAADKCLVVELFDPKFLNRDFQKRCQYVTSEYRSIIVNPIDINITLGQLNYLFARWC